jgi:hypothetical protein
MQFHWGGDVIYRDTRLPNKRFVIGSPRTPVTTDIREWLGTGGTTPGGDRVLQSAVNGIAAMPAGSAWGTFDQRAHRVWDYVARHIRYNFDKDRQGYEDFWLFPDETLSLGIGDCEDSAILLAALLLAAGISPFCVRVILGKMYDANGVLLGQHAWTVYQDEGGVWRLLEATLDTVPSALPAADAMARPGGRQIYWPEFCFNAHHLWWIRPPNRSDAAPPPGLDEYLLRTALAGQYSVEMRPERRAAIWERMEQVARGGP